MTALIALKDRDGSTYVAADSRVSWGSEPGYPRKDDLQKVYALSPSVVLGICGDLAPARAVIRRCQEWVDSNSLDRLTSNTTACRARLLVATLFSAWGTLRLTGRVYLVLGIGRGLKADLYTWSSLAKRPGGPRYLWRIESVQPGEFKVLGSVNNDPDVVHRLSSRLRTVALAERISPEQREALLEDALTQVFARGAGDKVQVGGLFQIVTYDNGDFFMSGYEAGRVSVSGGPNEYSVSLTYNPATGCWEQVDTHGKVIRLKTIMEADLSPPRGLGWEFRY